MENHNILSPVGTCKTPRTIFTRVLRVFYNEKSPLF